MAKILSGKEVAASLNERVAARAHTVRAAGVQPLLAIVRVGADTSAVAYERGAMKRCEAVGVEVRRVLLEGDCTQRELIGALEALNADTAVHGILLLRPLPKTLDEAAACEAIAPAKDVDAATQKSLARGYTGFGEGFVPCTAQSCMEILHHYGIDPAGKRAVVLGRSLVIGRPVAMLLLAENATPTICHSKTVDAPSIAREADIVIVAIGHAASIGAEYFSAGQTVIDVGTNWDAKASRLVGDVRFDEVEPLVGAITPVPGGVGSVTTSVLAAHVVASAEASLAETGA